MSTRRMFEPPAPPEPTELPSRPDGHPDECPYCRKRQPNPERPAAADLKKLSKGDRLWLTDLEHTVLRLAAVAGEKGARPADMTWRENRVINALLKLEAKANG